MYFQKYNSSQFSALHILINNCTLLGFAFQVLKTALTLKIKNIKKSGYERQGKINRQTLKQIKNSTKLT